MNKQIEALIQDELTRARTMFAPINSNHEGYAVVLEEMEEADGQITLLKHRILGAWCGTKDNDNALVNAYITQAAEHARGAIKELIQVAAMCDRWAQDVLKEAADGKGQ